MLDLHLTDEESSSKATCKGPEEVSSSANVRSRAPAPRLTCCFLTCERSREQRGAVKDATASPWVPCGSRLWTRRSALPLTREPVLTP